MRILLDTNIIIPLEDSDHEMADEYADLVRLANEHRHVLTIHPRAREEINKAENRRREMMKGRLSKYVDLPELAACPWNNSHTSDNDRVDNEMLYAIDQNAAHVFITEDKGIHRKSKRYGLGDRVLFVQQAVHWLQQLYDKSAVELPSIEEKELATLTRFLDTNFFDSLREGYPGFDDWFASKARDGRKAWVVQSGDNTLEALCIFAVQIDEQITSKVKLKGRALKLCTFKVDRRARGRKIGELFLKAAFQYATKNRCEHIFIHGNEDKHGHLFMLLEDFGFEKVGNHRGESSRDSVYIKLHPSDRPSRGDLEAFEYYRKYSPHIALDDEVRGYIVPIKPAFHERLFPNCPSVPQRPLEFPSSVSNAIKLAYLCRANTKEMNPGDLLLFYRSCDLSALTTIGVVESFSSLNDAESIAALVSRRTVYSMGQIESMVNGEEIGQTKEVKVILFRTVRHYEQEVSRQKLIDDEVLSAAPQSIVRIKSADALKRIVFA